MNLIEVIGFVGNDPEERVTPSGKKVVSFRIADNIKSGDKEETLWWRVTCWGDQFDRILAYIKKGSLIIVHGEFRRKPETYQDREGQTQVSLEITATQIRFAPSSAKADRQLEGGATEERRSGYQAPYSPSPSSVGPSSVPGGFRPGNGSDEFNEDNLPF